MREKLLLNSEVEEIAEAYLQFALAESGIHAPIAVEFKDFQTNILGEIKNKAKDRKLEIEALAQTLIDILPEGKCTPSGLSIKSPKRDVIKKLDEFFKAYKKEYTNAQILEAVKSYGEYAERVNFQQVSPLNYALMKNGQSKIAALCDTVKTEVPTETPKIDWI